MHWTDRLHGEGWQRSTRASLLRRVESLAVPFAQTVLMAPTIRRCDATIAMFESEANFLAALRRGVPRSRQSPLLVISCWLAHVLTRSSPRRRAGYRWAYRSVDLLYYFSTNQGEMLRDILRLPDERLRFLPFGVDTETFCPIGQRDEGYLLAVGRDKGRDWPTFFDAVKGLDMVVKVLCRPSQIAGLTVPGNVEILGHVDRERYRQLLGGATVVAVVTRPVEYPSGQSVLLEAMAMGKTVVATATPSLSEYLDDGSDCLAVPPGDADAVRERIEEAAGDEGLRARIGSAARRTVETAYSSDAMWDVVADDVFRLMGHRR